MKSFKTIKSAVSRAVARVSGLALGLAASTAAHAGNMSSGGSGFAWEATLERLLDSFQGPVARAGIFAAIIITGLMMAFGEHSGGTKKLIGIVFGGSIVIGVSSFGRTLLGAGF